MYLEASRLPIRRKDVQLEVHAGLADTYARLGEFEKAYTHHMEAWKLYEDIFREERAAKIAEMQARFDLESKEREARIYRQKNEELTQKNRLIEEQKVRIEQTLAELRKSEMSLDWVHDRLQEVVGRSIVGQSKEMKAVLELVGKVARAENTTVMIIDGSGTGKELIAKAIHDASNRARCFFHAVNSSAISSTLFESEFFGHEKGAFTGAEQAKPGWFEVANGGTLFLDEIGFMPVEQQIKLLRVLEERNVIRVGARNQIAVNVRVISATNQNLARLVEEGKFREDLYHRLAAFVIHIPPLRERKADIAPLWEHYVGKFCVAMNKSIRRIERRCSICWSITLPRQCARAAQHGRARRNSVRQPDPPAPPPRPPPRETRRAVAANCRWRPWRQAVRRALDFAGGNQARAARSWASPPSRWSAV
jgi:transcriptional regulator with PAS, ATPase and Fis domain